jgi:hypothetical protein
MTHYRFETEWSSKPTGGNRRPASMVENRLFHQVSLFSEIRSSYLDSTNRHPCGRSEWFVDPAASERHASDRHLTSAPNVRDLSANHHDDDDASNEHHDNFYDHFDTRNNHHDDLASDDDNFHRPHDDVHIHNCSDHDIATNDDHDTSDDHNDSSFDHDDASCDHDDGRH